MRKMWAMGLVVMLATVMSARASAWQLVDDFDNGLSSWTVYSAYSTVDIIVNPLASGPVGSVARLDMTQVEYDKYAEIIHSQLLTYDGTSTMELAFDLGYLYDAAAGNAGNYFQGIALLDSTGTMDALIGHKGYLPTDPVNSEMFRARTLTTQLTSTAPLGHGDGEWYHYVITMTPTETVVSVYSWISSDPADYASATAVWSATLPAMTADSYNMSFVNQCLHTGPDGYDNSRDTMYLDNVYCNADITQSVEFSPAGKYIPGPTAISLSCADSGATIYYTTDGTTPTPLSTQYTTPVTVNVGTTLKAIAVASGKAASWVATQVYESSATWHLVDDFSNGLANWTVYSAYTTVDVIDNPLAGGPAGSVARLDMTQMEYDKYANIIHSQLLTYDGTSTMELAFDLGYKWDSQAAYGGNYFQGISLFDSTGTMDALIGHKGYLPTDPVNSKMFRARTLSTQLTSTAPLGHGDGEWYHYVITMTPTETVVSVYSWVSSDPADYASATPVWLVTLPAMTADSYDMYFLSSNFYTAPDPQDSSRDTMYLDNLYCTADVTKAVEFSPAGKFISGPTAISLSCADSGATIYYTTDGTTPTTSSTQYTTPVTVNVGTTLKAIAVATGKASSWVQSQTYQSSATWYLVDDFSNGLSNWTVYSAYTTVDVIANPLAAGPVGSVARLDMTQMEYDKYAEIIHRQLLTYDGTSTMELAFDLGYLWDSQAAYGGNYFQGISLLDSTGTMDALIGHKGYLPTDPVNSEMFRARTLTTQLTSTAPLGHGDGEWYHYVVRMTPTETVVSVYSWVSNDPDDYAYAIPVWTVSLPAMTADSYDMSFVSSNFHTAPDAYDSSRDTMYLDNVYSTLEAVDGVAFSPDGTELSGPTAITLSCDDATASIYYTTDGSVPTTSSNLYSGAITVNSGDTLTAIAVASGKTSWITSREYTYPQAAAPIFSPAPCGTYISGDTAITISCATAGAEIRYTTDGSTPTMSSNLYAGPVTVSDGMTLQAIAGGASLLTSSVTSQAYAVPTSYNGPATIPAGSATVDGDLSDWADADWVSLDELSEINTTQAALEADVPEAYYAARWQANKIYVAVKVRDTSHTLTDDYGTWNAHDSIELFIHTDNDGDVDYHAYNTLAQQYEIGITNSDQSAVWAYVGASAAHNLISSSYGVAEVAGSVGGAGDEWLYYEVALTPYTYFGLLETGDLSTTVVSDLFAGEVVGLDVDVISNSVGSYLGKRSENTMPTRYANWSSIGIHTLADAQLPGDANGDGAVDVGDLGILAANYGGTGKTWAEGDFNGDGAVDVGDLGILAANYGTGSSSANWDADYAEVFGETADEELTEEVWPCSSLGLPLIAGLVLMGLMLVKLED